MYRDIWYSLPKEIDLSVPIIDRKNLYHEISKVTDFLNSLDNCKYFFSCGSALGLVRDSRFIDWDTDVDIDLIDPSEDEINIIINHMNILGYSFQRVLKSNGRYSQIVFIKEPYHSIDFCFWYCEKKNYINDVPETLFFKRVHPKDIYKKFKKIRIQNIDFNIPYDINLYFELLYGTNWQTPKKYKNWLKNANDLKFDFLFFRVLRKILWKFKIIRKKL